MESLATLGLVRSAAIVYCSGPCTNGEKVNFLQATAITAARNLDHDANLRLLRERYLLYAFQLYIHLHLLRIAHAAQVATIGNIDLQIIVPPRHVMQRVVVVEISGRLKTDATLFPKNGSFPFQMK
jgi:hypothetical protein